MEERVGINQRFAVIAYAAALVVGTLASSIVSATVDIGTNLYLYLCYLIPQAGYISVFCIMCRVKKVPFSAVIKKENIKFVHYVFALFIAVGLLFFALLPNYGITLLFEKIGSKATAVVPSLAKPADYVLCTLIICILPAIGEELIFRKAFCDGLSDVADVKVILLCGIAFSLSHLNLAQTVHQFVLGCCLGFVYVKTKNITLTAFMHFLNNAMALFIESITGAEIWNNIVVLAVSCAVGFVVMAAGFFGLIKKTNKLNNDKKGKLEPITAVFVGVLAVAWMICAVLSFY